MRNKIVIAGTNDKNGAGLGVSEARARRDSCRPVLIGGLPTARDPGGVA